MPCGLGTPSGELKSRLPNHNGEAAAAGCAGRYGAGHELVVGDGGAFDSAADQIAVQTVGQVAAIEPGKTTPAGSAADAWR